MVAQLVEHSCLESGESWVQITKKLKKGCSGFVELFAFTLHKPC